MTIIDTQAVALVGMSGRAELIIAMPESSNG
jgi:hypothetical protein